LEPIDLAAKVAQIDEFWSPRIVGYFNDCKLQLVKVKGEFVWHSHPETDDFFLVVAGRLTIELRDGEVVLEPGQMFVVPCGIEHRPRADEETHVLLIEPRGTPNTGDAAGVEPALEREL
jgi:mannose-6-phosphate isomerase-like protein (cupin superfamily)